MTCEVTDGWFEDGFQRLKTALPPGARHRIPRIDKARRPDLASTTQPDASRLTGQTR
jgi:hypothetical protein